MKTMELELVVKKEGPGEFVVWPQNLTDRFRGAAGRGETPKEAMDDFWHDMNRMSFLKWINDGKSD